MGILSDEFLFYGGLIFAGVSALVSILYLSLTRVKKIRLDAKMDAEYGRPEKKQ